MQGMEEGSALGILDHSVIKKGKRSEGLPVCVRGEGGREVRGGGEKQKRKIECVFVSKCAPI